MTLLPTQQVSLVLRVLRALGAVVGYAPSIREQLDAQLLTPRVGYRTPRAW
jgi:hypothetical protein